MNRRNFIGLAVAAALAPAALVEGPFDNVYFKGVKLEWDEIFVKHSGPVVSPATYTWWRNKGESRIDMSNDPALIAEMERLYLECLRDPARPNLVIWRTT